MSEHRYYTVESGPLVVHAIYTGSTWELPTIQGVDYASITPNDKTNFDTATEIRLTHPSVPDEATLVEHVATSLSSETK